MSYGLPGDEDPLHANPEPECPCGDLLLQNLLQEWFCPTCDTKEDTKEAK